MKIRRKLSLAPQNTDLQYHASSVLPSGTAAFFGGTKEGHEDTYIYLAHFNGGGVSSFILAKNDFLPRWNPVLFEEGGVQYLFYKKGTTVHNWHTAFCISSDGGFTWGEEINLPNIKGIPQGSVKNKTIRLSNGRWLAGTSQETCKYWSSYAALSSAQGRYWEISPVPMDYKNIPSLPEKVWEGLRQEALWENDLGTAFRWEGIIQPTVWESSAGNCHMLCRSTYGCVYRSDSSDYGQTWAKAYPTDIPNNNSGIDVTTHKGVLFLAHNPVADNWGPRSPLSLSVSKDNGTTWHRFLDLETAEGEFSYPALSAAENSLHITYTWNRKNIIYTEIEV